MARPDDRTLLLKVLTSIWDAPPWPIRFWKGDFYHWIGDRYRPISDRDLSSLFSHGLADIQNGHVNNKDVTLCLDAAKDLLKVSDHEDMPVKLNDDFPDSIMPCPHLFSFKNGLLDIEKLASEGNRNRTLLPHSPLYFTDQCVDYDLDVYATCPEFDKAIFYACDDDAELVECFQMWCGYLLVRDTSEQKFLLVHGEAGTGKSFFHTMIRFLLGEKACSFVPLKKFTDKFSMARIVGKRVNIDTDMASLESIAEEVLKPWTGGDPVDIERKYKDPYDAIPEARLMFFTNSLPHISDKSNAIWRRLLMLPLNRVIPPHVRNRTYVTQTLDTWGLKDELPGIFNWALRGLTKLREHGSLKEPSLSIQAREQYKVDCNPVAQWLEEKCRIGVYGRILKQDVYAIFIEWALALGFRRMSITTFGRILLACTNGKVSSERQRVGSRRCQYFIGLQIIQSE